MRKVYGNIFEDHIIQLYLNVHYRFGGDLVRSSVYTMIFILVYAESLKSSTAFSPSLVDDFTCVHSKNALLTHILST